MDKMEMKVCRICGIEKNIDEFPISRGYVETRCRECKNTYTREYSKKNRSRITQQQKEYRKRNPEIDKACYQRANEKRNAIKRKKTQLKKLSKILLKFVDLKENIEKFKNITEVPVASLTPEQKKERNKIKQIEWRARNRDKLLKYRKEYRDKNKDKINSKKRMRYAIKKGEISSEQIEFNNELEKALADMGF